MCKSVVDQTTVKCPLLQMDKSSIFSIISESQAFPFRQLGYKNGVHKVTPD